MLQASGQEVALHLMTLFTLTHTYSNFLQSSTFNPAPLEARIKKIVHPLDCQLYTNHFYMRDLLCLSEKKNATAKCSASPPTSREEAYDGSLYITSAKKTKEGKLCMYVHCCLFCKVDAALKGY